MGQIQSSIGLITGVPITDTVDQLIAVAGRPRDRLVERTAGLQQQQVGVAELTATVIGLQFALEQLGSEDLFAEKNVSSSNAALLVASLTGAPTPGSYEFTPIRRAQTHQVVSNGVAAADAALGEGTLRFRQGGFVDASASLDELNGGGGVQRGKIRITDRSGASAVVDLRFARSTDDVLEAINSLDSINVLASASGDSFKLVDQTGQTTANLRVQEVGLGSTAADLGLGNVDLAASEVVGADIRSLHGGLALSRLNDGNGISIRSGVPDLSVSFRDNSTALEIEFTGDEKTIQDLLDTINAADPARITAQISADGDRIELQDLTADSGGTFAVSSPLSGTLAEDLGLTGTAVGDVLSGERIQAGLKSTLLRTLNGGSGLSLGQLDLTDRAGNTANVDLSSAESLQDVIDAIENAGLGITARVNSARNGIELRDTTGSTASNLIVANGDATNTADQLQLAIDDAVTTTDSGSLARQVVSEQTTLDSLNQGNGVQQGSFLLTDANGQVGAVNLTTLAAEDVGDVLDAINGLGIGISARINDQGDGILLSDTTGNGSFSVEDSGNGTAAADLGIGGTSTLVDTTHQIEGSSTLEVQIDSDDTLEDLIQKINDLDAGVTASILNDGSSSNPYRLALTSQTSGAAGELLVDGLETAFAFQEIAAAEDALLLVGDADSLGAGILTASSTDSFESVLDGVKLTVAGASEEPVTINVSSSNSSLVSKVEQVVSAYNGLRDKLEELTFFNEGDSSTGLLFGSGETLRVETGIANLFSDRFFGLGDIQSLGELGIDFRDDGKLEFDAEKFNARYEEDADAVQEFFTNEEIGFLAKADALIETLAGEENSLLVNRSATLQSRIESNAERVEFMNARLEVQREQLLQQFFNLELIISRLRSNLDTVSQIAGIPPLT